MRKRKRQAVKKLIQCAAVIAAGVLYQFVYAGYLVQRKEQRASNRRTGSSADAAGRAAGY